MLSDDELSHLFQLGHALQLSSTVLSRPGELVGIPGTRKERKGEKAERSHESGEVV